jgi:membrane protein implicated in regulation of membrane protease activity
MQTTAMQMTALYWLYAGIALILFEIMTPGFVSLFFGLSALTLALVVWLAPGLAQGWQWLLFALFSVLYIAFLRKSLKKTFNGDEEVSGDPGREFDGKRAVVMADIAPDRPGRVEVNGTSWTAEAAQPLTAGTQVRIVRKKNLTFTVEAVS